MPENESDLNSPEPPVPPAGPENEGPPPGPGQVPLGTPFAPEPGSDAPFTGGAEDELVAGEQPPAEELPAGPQEPYFAPGAAEGAPGEPPAGLLGASAPPPPGRPAAVSGGMPSDDDRLWAALAWISMVIIQVPLVSVVLLLAAGNRERPFQRYHAVTSLLFWIGAAIYEMLAGLAYALLSLVIPVCGCLCLWPILLVPHVIAVWYAIQAYQGNASEIPAISDFARNQRWI